MDEGGRGSRPAPSATTLALRCARTPLYTNPKCSCALQIKHARLAMMAAAGWPIAELLDAPLAKLIGAPSALASNGRAPSLFNGGLFEGPQGAFLLLAALATAVLEVNTLDNVRRPPKPARPCEALRGPARPCAHPTSQPPCSQAYGLTPTDYTKWSSPLHMRSGEK